MRSRLVLAAAGSCVLLLATACSVSVTSGGDELRTGKLETEISEGIEDQTGIVPDSVTCPENIKIEEGDTFECTAVVEGAEVTIDVVQNDDEGNVSWELAG